MKNVLIFAAIITLKLFAGGGALYAQIPISNLPSTTNTVGAYIPVARNGYNYKIITDSLTNKKVDSLNVSGDTLYYYKNNGTRYFVGVIVGGSGSDTTSLSNRINLKLSIADTAAMLSPYLREVDTASLSSRINLKLNISDTASKTWDWADITGKPVLILGGDTASMLSGYTRVQRFTDSLAAHTTRFNSVTSSLATKLNISDTSNMRPRLYAGSNVTITGTYPNLTIASTGGGSSDTSTFIVDTTFKRLAYAINEDSLRLKSVTIDVTTGQPASYEETDSTLKFTIPQFDSEIYGVVPPSTGTTTDFLRADGTWATPAGGGGADSSVFATQYRLDTVKANRVRYVDTATMLTNYPTFSSFTSGRLALVNGSKTLYSSSKFNFSDATYPTMSIIGSDPLIYIGPSATLLNNPAFGHSAGAVIYGGATYKSVQLVDQISGGIQMARFYTSGGTIYNNLNGLVISNTLSSPSNYQGSYTIQRTVPYAGTGLNYHGFTDQTDFRVGSNSFNSFGSFVTIGNNRTSQGHFAAFQSVWYKDSTNTLNDIYDFVSAVSEMRAGTVDSLFRFKVFEASKTGGTINVQYGIHIPALTSATTNYGAYIEDNVGLGTASPTAKLDINSDKFRVRTSKTPSSATDTGNAGDICWDSNYIYICVSTNSWKRVAIATW